MGRTSTARDRLLDAACELIHGRGYSAIGVADICAAADVRKGSFYHFFDSKQTLAVEVVRSAWTKQRPQWEAALTDDLPALARLERLLRLQAEVQQAEKSANGIMRGCLFGNLAQEMNQDTAVAAAVSDVFDEQETLVLQALAAAAAEGSIDPERGTRPTARAVLAQLEGAVLFAKLRNDPTALDDLWPHSAMLLGVQAA